MLSNANFVVGNRQNTTGRRNNTTYAIDGWFSFGLLVVVVVSLLLQTYFVLFCRCCCCFGWKCLRVSMWIVKREAAGMHTHSFQLHDDGRWTYHADAAMLSAHNTSIHTHTRACIWGVCGTHKHTLHTLHMHICFVLHLHCCLYHMCTLCYSAFQSHQLTGTEPAIWSLDVSLSNKNMNVERSIA